MEDDAAFGVEVVASGGEGGVELGLELLEDFGSAAGATVVDAGGEAVLASVPAVEGVGELLLDLADVGCDDDEGEGVAAGGGGCRVASRGGGGGRG